MDGLSSSCSSVLLLGEGNFSFARSLSQKLEKDVRIVATSFEKEVDVCRWKHGKENIDALTEKGVVCLFGMDATTIHTCMSLEGQSFDGIIFNFPHIVGKANIAKNRDLLKRFFQSSAQKLRPSGQVLVTLCNGQGGTPADRPQREVQNAWQIVAMATYGNLILTGTVPFQAGEFQEYDSTGYRGQDKGFLTQRAVTHVFERSPPDLLPETKETFAAKIDGNNFDFCCPPDLAPFMDRNLLSDINHPLGLLNNTLVSSIQSLLPHVEISPECNIASAIDDAQKDCCSGVYRLRAAMNIHESSPPASTLRPHLLCHIDGMIDRYANNGCVLTGRGFHKCAISTRSFPIMHQLLLVLPKLDTDVTDVVSKVLQGIHDDRTQLQVQSVNNDEDVKQCDVALASESVKSLKRQHSEMDKSDVLIDNAEMWIPKCEQCWKCGAPRITTCKSLQLSNTSGYQTIVGLCGTIKRDDTIHDIILLYLDQLLMHLLHIHDIRLLWSTDTNMWEETCKPQADKLFGDFTPKSKHPASYIRDVSFWIPTVHGFDELHLMSVLRQASGLLLKRAWLKDTYRDDVRGDVNRCYRLEYLSCDRALSKEKLMSIHQRVLELLRVEMELKAR